MTSIEKLQNNVNQVNSDFNAIKDKIVACGVEVADGTPTYELRHKVTEVYNKGKQDEYDAFWDTFQLNGNRTRYAYAFSLGNFSVDTFYPKYDIIPIGSLQMAFNSFIGDRVYNDEPTWSLKQRLEECGVKFDTSQATSVVRLFDYCYHITEVPTIDLSSISNTYKDCNRLFGDNLRLVTIEKLIVKDTIAPTNAFYNCSELVNIVIEGTIGQNGFNFQWSTKLSKASITSIINALSVDTTNLVLTLSKAAVDKAFESSSGANDGSTANNNAGTVEWQTLISTRKNWHIALV